MTVMFVSRRLKRHHDEDRLAGALTMMSGMMA